MTLSVELSYGQFTVGADFRARTELRDGSRILLDSTSNPSFVSSQRSRLITSFKKENMEMKITMQNARIWGQDRERGNVPNLNLTEGWLRYSFNEKLAVKVGRQHLVLDDGRIFGMRNWNDIAVSHDLAVLQYADKKWRLQTGAGYNNDRNRYFEGPYEVNNYYKYMAFLWANRKIGESLDISILNSVDAHEDENNFETIYPRITSGIYINKGGKDSKFSMEASAYYQYGKNPEGIKQNAYMISIIPRFNINNWLYSKSGLNFFSGNDETNDNGQNNAFNKLFGDGHRYYGYMDYFLNIESNTRGGGMRELFAGLFFKTGKKSELEVSYHHFALGGQMINTDITTEVVAANRNLGNEIDLQLKIKLQDDLSVRFAYATMFATPSMEFIKGGDHSRYQQWATVMLIAKPTFFTSEKNKAE